MEIAQDLVGLGDDLPTLNQCIIDVKAGVYSPSYSDVFMTGGQAETIIDGGSG